MPEPHIVIKADQHITPGQGIKVRVECGLSLWIVDSWTTNDPRKSNCDLCKGKAPPFLTIDELWDSLPD